MLQSSALSARLHVPVVVGCDLSARLHIPVVVGCDLRARLHVPDTLGACSLYALRVLAAHGLPPAALYVVARATALTRPFIRLFILVGLCKVGGQERFLKRM